MKIPGLLIQETDEMLQTLFEEVRTEMKLTVEDFLVFLKTKKGQQLFSEYDKALAPLFVDAYTTKTFRENQRQVTRSRATIVKKNQDLLQSYDAYVHTVHSVYYRTLAWMTKNKPAKTMATKDLVNIVLYGNLCRMADQIGLLMQNGFPDAALMLWRSFYEYGVVACFLLEKDSPELSQRFKDASYKDVFKKMESFNNRHVEMKFPALDADFIKQSNEEYETLKSKYGKNFLERDYAWAEGFVTGKPNFRAIEDTMNFGRYRPFYIWASSRSHPNYYGLTGFFSNVETLFLNDIVRRDSTKKSMIDPAQLTLSLFDLVNKRFFFIYSPNSEASSNLAVFAELYKRFGETISSS